MKPGTVIEAPEGAKAFRPLRDYLVVRPIEQAGMVGKLYLPDMKSLDCKNGVRGEVLAGGPECGPDKFWKVKVGDIVHLSAYGTTATGAKIKLNGEVVHIIRARDINGVIASKAE